ncbi:hypothetical protein D3C71_1480180 [compost metagenome]
MPTSTTEQLRERDEALPGLGALYRVGRENTGCAVASYVARFCGECIGVAETAEDAEKIAVEHERLRRALEL